MADASVHTWPWAGLGLVPSHPATWNSHLDGQGEQEAPSEVPQSRNGLVAVWGAGIGHKQVLPCDSQGL